MPHTQAIGGFSLLELICVIVILGILAAVAGPKLLDTSAFDVRGYTDELAGAVRDAETVARASGCEVQLSIRPRVGYRAQLPAPGACASPGVFTVPVLKADGTPLQGTPPSGADVKTRVILYLRANGALMGVSGPTSITVTGGSAGITPLILQIDPYSGLVTVT